MDVRVRGLRAVIGFRARVRLASGEQSWLFSDFAKLAAFRQIGHEILTSPKDQPDRMSLRLNGGKGEHAGDVDGVRRVFRKRGHSSRKGGQGLLPMGFASKGAFLCRWESRGISVCHHWVAVASSPSAAPIDRPATSLWRQRQN